MAALFADIVSTAKQLQGVKPESGIVAPYPVLGFALGKNATYGKPQQAALLATNGQPFVITVGSHKAPDSLKHRVIGLVRICGA